MWREVAEDQVPACGREGHGGVSPRCGGIRAARVIHCGARTDYYHVLGGKTLLADRDAVRTTTDVKRHAPTCGDDHGARHQAVYCLGRLADEPARGTIEHRGCGVA